MTVVGVGVDVVDVARFARVTTRTPTLLTRLLGEVSADDAGRPERLAARFAAKEAVTKALGQRVPWREIEVLGGSGQRPHLLLRGRALRHADALGVRDWKLSLSHDGGIAVAMVIAQT